ncbi:MULTISPECIES: Fe-S cluster assembly sulfur transfer protein SufU [Methylococcus]|uniref:SUF system NifU family Fe-S cluster assembly protein n=1 Tax=Methylococcus capsulatus TaxID=414 RepID=A0ABZ2F2Y9_METCP|nr:MULTISPECIES: SUF system NifU family Fe-S cluster assembly protein [Methylococcus]MDF9392187.1 SUF system NifU family Fe-S cluster assembly protein [Methylococcus capsulatus]
MLDQIRDLYQEVVFDHNRNPRNFRVMEDANRTIEGFNPLCGDRITLYVKIDDAGIIRDISFQGSGCAISTASASLMTEIVRGMHEHEAHALFQTFHRIATGQDEAVNLEELGKLAVLAGVRAYPARVKCATLAWHSLEAALENKETTVTTE